MSEYIIIDNLLLFLLIATSMAALVMRNLIAATMLMSLYSLLMALIWLKLDAPDVAFTEAAVCGGIQTILLIGAMVLVGSEEKKSKPVNWTAFLLVVLTTAALIYGTLDMPYVGDPKAPAQIHIVPEYISQTVEKNSKEQGSHVNDGHKNYFHGHVPNLVTSVIVNYRAYDTLFEVAVIFTAGLSLILLLRRRRY